MNQPVRLVCYSLAIFAWLIAQPAAAQYSYLDDANDPQALPPTPLPSFKHHKFPRTLMHELKGPNNNAAYGKYDFIDAHGSAFDRVEKIQGGSPDTMMLRHISARAYQGFNANRCRISQGIAFDATTNATQGGPEKDGCGVYAGHWLYKAGTKTKISMNAQANSVRVEDASRIQSGQYAVIYDAPAGSFNNAEHVKVSSVDRDSDTVTFSVRGFKSMPRTRAAGAIIATHVLGNGPESELWAFNMGSQAPTDANGETFASFYAKWLGRNYDRFDDGRVTTANVAGILFDADMYFQVGGAKADYNNDLVVDEGISPSGVNWLGKGLDQFYAKVRAQLPNLHILSGVYDARGYASTNGVQLENWLDVGNGDFNANPQYKQLNSMFATYLFNMSERSVLPPLVHNLTKTPTKTYPSGTNANSNAPLRLALSMALMDDGYFGTHSNTAGDGWYDEYAVDVKPGSPNFGKAIDKDNLTGIQTHKGWLGKPLQKFRRVYDPAAFEKSKSLMSNGNFESGVGGWSGNNTNVSSSSFAFQGSGALYASKMRSFTSRATGATIKSPQVSLKAGKEYTIAFAARASEEREIRVSLGSFNDQIPIGTNWRRYVMSFRQGNGTNSGINFQVGRENTEMWLDSVFVFEGSANVLRREFENGIVLANATPLAKTVNLGDTFQKINGRQDSAVNNGKVVTQVTLPPYDGILLVRLDPNSAPPPDDPAPPPPPPEPPPPEDPEDPPAPEDPEDPPPEDPPAPEAPPAPPANEGQIGDFVWQDDNSNGIQDNGEEGLPGVVVDLLDCSNNVLSSTSTNESGQYSFKQLAAGNYAVGFHTQSGMSLSPQMQGNNSSADSNADPETGRTSCMSLGSSQSRNSIDAGMMIDEVEEPMSDPDAAFGDLVWLDTNRNGIQNQDEPGLPGAEVRLLSCSGDLLATTFSDDNGRYRFERLEKGQYRLEFPEPVGMERTDSKQGDNSGKDSNPAKDTGRTKCLALASNQFRGGIDVGLVTIQSNPPTPAAPPSDGDDPVSTDSSEDGVAKNFGESSGGSTGALMLGLLGLIAWRRRRSIG